MKTVHLEKLPDCDYKSLAPGCEGKAVYDAPNRNGTWGYMCEHHYQMFKSPMADEVACKLAQKDLVEPKYSQEEDRIDRAKLGVEPDHDDLDYWEAVLWDGLREIECPECGDKRSMEPDATGVYSCEGCGIPVKCPAPII